MTGECHIHAAYIYACGNCGRSDEFHHSIINHEYGHAILGEKHSTCCGLVLMSGGQWEGWFRRFQTAHDIEALQVAPGPYHHCESDGYCQ